MKKNNYEENKQRASNSLQEYQSRITEICESYVTDPNKIMELIEFKSQFYEYSLKNTLLIQKQNPHVSFVQSYAAWNKIDAHVLKGEKGLKIFVPVQTTYVHDPEKQKYVPISTVKKENPSLYKAYQLGKVESYQATSFRIGSVFDISQTDFPKQRYPELYSMGYSSEQHDKIILGMKEYAEKEHGIRVRSENLQSIALRGLSYTGRKKIDINERLESTQYLSTLNHEIGHQLLHEHSDKPVQIKEFEADVFSILLDYHMRTEITDARKKHLVLNYKQIIEASEEQNNKEIFEAAFDHVFRTYAEEIPNIDKYVEKYIDRNTNKENTNDMKKMKDMEYER